MHSVAFSSDGSLIAVGTGSCVTLWNSGDGAYIASLPGPLSLQAAFFPLLIFVPGTPYLAGTAQANHFKIHRITLSVTDRVILSDNSWQL